LRRRQPTTRKFSPSLVWQAAPEFKENCPMHNHTVRHFLIAFLIILFTSIPAMVETGTAVSQGQRDQSAAMSSAAWECWNLGGADACEHAILALDMLSPTYGWAVGDNGTALRWNGAVWQPVPAPTSHRLTAVKVLAIDDVWAAGGSLPGPGNETYTPVIMHWNGSHWIDYPLDGQNYLTAIDLASPDFGIALGFYGMLRWDGSSWSQLDSRRANDVSLLTPSDGWIVGPESMLLHWNGSELIQAPPPPTPTTRTLATVQMLAGDDVWTGGNLGTVWRWDGDTWQAMPTAGGSVSVLSMAAAGDGWALVKDTYSARIYQWDGSSWSLHSHTAPAHDIQYLSTTDGWVTGNSGSIQRWDGIRWGSMPPAHRRLTDVAMTGPAEAWGVGSYGAIAYWDGVHWRDVDSPTQESLISLALAGPNGAWAVGHAGTIIRLQGTSWTVVTSPTDQTLTAVAFTSADNGWAVGQAGTLLRYDGTGWELFDSPTNKSLNGVSLISESDGWIVGESRTFLRWNGAQWLPVVAQGSLSDFAYDVSMVDEDDGWAVGNKIWRWNGVEWAQMPKPVPFTLNRVSMLSATDGWILGQAGAVLRWNGEVWATAPVPAANSNIGIHLFAPDNGWIVGSGSLLRWNGTAWHSHGPLSGPPRGTLYNDVQFISPSAAWAVGQIDQMRSVIAYWNGRQWINQFVPSNMKLESVSMISETEGWAVGAAGVTLHWDGQLWRLVPTPTYHGFLYGVHALAPDQVWAVGSLWEAPYGSLIWRYDGHEWLDVPVTTTERLNAVQMLSLTDGWAVGNAGTILRWDGDEWREVPSPDNYHYRALYMLDSNNGWAVGYSYGGGNIVRWDGESWQTVEAGNPPPLYGIHMSTADEGWAAGADGTLLHWDGNEWTPAPLPIRRHIHGVSFVEGAGWAVGAGPILGYGIEVAADLSLYLPLVAR
jgi:hypothetical protein